MLWHYAKGKLVDEVRLGSQTDGSFEIVVKRPSDLSPWENAAATRPRSAVPIDR